MADFNLDEWLESEEAKTAIEAERLRITRPKSARPLTPPADGVGLHHQVCRQPAVRPRDEPPPNGPDDYGASLFESEPAPARPSFRIVAGGGVPEPQDLPASLLPVPAFDPDLLPENFRAWVEDIGTRMQVPLDYVAIAAMIGAGTLIGRKIVVRPKQRDNWTEVPNLWGIAVGPSGVMKSPAIKWALSPLRLISVRSGEEFAQKEEEYKRAYKKYEIEKKVLETAATRESQNKQGHFDGVDGKALADLLALKEPERPVMRRYIVSDSTVEKLGELLLENPIGILCNRDELFGLLDNLEREDRASDRAFYMSCWNGSDTIEVDRIGRGSRFINGACLSLIGSTQRGRLAAHLSHSLKGDRADDGLMQRFSMLVFPDVSEDWQMIDVEPDPGKRRIAYSTMEYLDELTADAAGAIRDEREAGELYTADAGDLPYLRFLPDAYEQFADWLPRHERRIRSRDMHPAMGAHLAKYKKLVPAIALISHLGERHTGLISATAVNRSIRWADFLEKHAWRAYASANVIAANGARAILNAIWSGKLKTTFTAREVQRLNLLGLDSAENVRAALDLLVDLAWLTIPEDPNRRRGRPSDKYALSSHPKAGRR
jgi:hypothetical protein